MCVHTYVNEIFHLLGSHSPPVEQGFGATYATPSKVLGRQRLASLSRQSFMVRTRMTSRRVSCNNMWGFVSLYAYAAWLLLSSLSVVDRARLGACEEGTVAGAV